MEADQTPLGLQSTCPFCGTANPLVMTTRDEYMRYQRREITAIQLTDGDKDQAEYLISGTCIPCWDRVFKEDEEDGNIVIYDLGEAGT